MSKQYKSPQGNDSGLAVSMSVTSPTMHNFTTSNLAESPSTPGRVCQEAQLRMEESFQGRESESIIRGDQISDAASNTSSDVVLPNMATLPQYDFKIGATQLAAFLAVFNITKHKLEGDGFPV